MRPLLYCAIAAWCGAQCTHAAEHPDPLPVPNSSASKQSEMKPYAEGIEYTRAKIEMVPIRGGKFVMGSPASEAKRKDREGPQHEVSVAPFWMAKCEITWDAYEPFMFQSDILRRQVTGLKPNKRDGVVDAVTRPTKPWTDMSFGMGKRGYPTICMTQHAARTFCQWLSAKTGRYYRLPTEAEWEYACRAGTTTAYHFGDDDAKLGEYAWFDGNTDGKYKKVGQKKPNPWGLHDMHGNVAEWVLDQFVNDGYRKHANENPLVIPTALYPRVVRGGSWDDRAHACRSSARTGSDESWKEQDPQLPQSIWYHTDARWVGFRIVRPLAEPTDQEKMAKWHKSEPVQRDEEK